MPSPLPPVIPPSSRRLWARLADGAEAYIPLAASVRVSSALVGDAEPDVTAALYTGFARSEKGSIAWKRNEGDIRKLIKYWAHGEGAAKIGWGKPCDFCSCVNHLRKYIPGDHEVKGFCARLHKRATGKWPGPRSKGKHCPC